MGLTERVLVKEVGRALERGGCGLLDLEICPGVLQPVHKRGHNTVSQACGRLGEDERDCVYGVLGDRRSVVGMRSEQPEGPGAVCRIFTQSIQDEERMFSRLLCPYVAERDCAFKPCF